MENIGKIIIRNSPLKPGDAIGKQLNPIGDISIRGIVNFIGFMEFLVLQNTRLCTVITLAEIIAYGIENVFCEQEDSKNGLQLLSRPV